MPGGLLGADYEVANGRYRFKKIYGGLNWTPNLRSPLTEPGVNVKAASISRGEREGSAPPTKVYSPFENTAGKLVEITVGSERGRDGSRTVTVVPIANEVALRNRDWVEGNLRKVDEGDRRQGRVRLRARTPAARGTTYFKRYFYPQADKDAVIVDERFNGGGQIADYYIDILRRPCDQLLGHAVRRRLQTPTAAIQGRR